MFVYRSYPLALTLRWTFKFIVVFALLASIPVVLHRFLHFDFILIPWLPIALIGTALAFYLGFKTNASYERLWEARKIWGGIVNESRTFTAMASTYVAAAAQPQVKRLIRRHVAWLTALRFNMREYRSWEHQNLRNDKVYRKRIHVNEFEAELQSNLVPYLSDEDLKYIMGKKNKAAQLLHLQYKDIEKLNAAGHLDDFRHAELGRVLQALYDEQGKSERIKNFPFPRQYASLNIWYVWLFIVLLPFGMIGEFEKLGEAFLWLNIPFCVIVSWVFYTMEMIGDYSENPFEGSYNDVPITAISKAIETDIFEMIGETELPAPELDRNGALF